MSDGEEVSLDVILRKSGQRQRGLLGLSAPGNSYDAKKPRDATKRPKSAKAAARGIAVSANTDGKAQCGNAAPNGAGHGGAGGGKGGNCHRPYRISPSHSKLFLGRFARQEYRLVSAGEVV